MSQMRESVSHAEPAQPIVVAVGRAQLKKNLRWDRIGLPSCLPVAAFRESDPPGCGASRRSSTLFDTTCSACRAIIGTAAFSTVARIV